VDSSGHLPITPAEFAQRLSLPPFSLSLFSPPPFSFRLSPSASSSPSFVSVFLPPGLPPPLSLWCSLPALGMFESLLSHPCSSLSLSHSLSASLSHSLSLSEREREEGERERQREREMYISVSDTHNTWKQASSIAYTHKHARTQTRTHDACTHAQRGQ
jgi:hypothetical protein